MPDSCDQCDRASTASLVRDPRTIPLLLERFHEDSRALAIRATAAVKLQDSGVMHFHRILCPVDFSESSHRALHVAVALAGNGPARVTILHVGRDIALFPALVAGVDPVVVPFPERCERAAKLARFVQPFVSWGRPIDVVLEEGDPALVIAATAKRLHTDLIVMGSHGRGGLGRRLQGSVCSELMRITHVPVLAVGSKFQPAASMRGFLRILHGPSEEERCYAESLAESPRRSTIGVLTGTAVEMRRATEVADADLIVIERHHPAAPELMHQAKYAVLVVDPVARQEHREDFPTAAENPTPAQSTGSHFPGVSRAATLAQGSPLSP